MDDQSNTFRFFVNYTITTALHYSAGGGRELTDGHKSSSESSEGSVTPGTFIEQLESLNYCHKTPECVKSLRLDAHLEINNHANKLFSASVYWTRCSKITSPEDEDEDEDAPA